MKCNLTLLVKNLLNQEPKEPRVARKTHIYDISCNQSPSSLARWKGNKENWFFSIK